MLWSMGSQRVGHDLTTRQQQQLQLQLGGWANTKIPLEKLFILGPWDLRKWILDFDASQDRAVIVGSHFSTWYPQLQLNNAKSSYFESLTFPQIHRAFTEFRFGQTTTACIS